MELPAAALEGLSRVYKTIAEDGMVDIGLQAALDVGVPASGYIHVQERVLKSTRLGEGTNVQKVTNTGSGKRIAAPEPIMVERDGEDYVYQYHGRKYDNYVQHGLTAEDIAALVVVEHRAC